MKIIVQIEASGQVSMKPEKRSDDLIVDVTVPIWLTETERATLAMCLRAEVAGLLSRWDVPWTP